MANTRVQSLFVLTLLQLCQAQGPDNLSESWYLANTITDGHQRKTISEIFSTESPFSETNPILVLPKSTSGPSTIASSTSLPPSLFTRDYTRTFSSSFPSTSFASTKSPQVEITQYTEQTQPPWQSTAVTSKVNEQTILGQGPTFANSFLVPDDNLDQHQTTQRQYLTSTTPITFPSSYPIYENAPVDGPKEQQSGLFENKEPQLDFVRQPQPTRQPSSTISPRTTRVYGSSTTGASTWPTRRPLYKESSTKRPSTVSAEPNKYTNTPQKSSYETLPLKIRVVGPRGSITNVNIGQKLVVAPKTTTTKKPTTTTTKRTPKPKKNTYEACLSGCKARRGPICAIPLSAPWLNPDQLKGFPSVCHMACFNSYKKEPYEKVLDGRCGRLKTRIQSFDTGAKLKRDELQKSQYFVDDDHHTVVEVSHLK